MAMDTKDFLVCADSELTNLEMIQKGLHSMDVSLANRLDRLRGLYRETELGIPGAKEEYIEESRKLQAVLRRLTAECYDNVSAVGYFFAQRDAPDEQNKTDFARSLTPAFDAWIVEDALLVKTPLAMQKAFGTVYMNHNIPSSSYLYFAFFRRPITLLLDLLYESNRDFFTRSREKTLTFVFNYSPDSVAKDADNHDTKTITDAITGYFPGGDSAAFCSFFYMSTQLPDLAPGTYIAVRRGCESPTPRAFIHEQVKNREALRKTGKHKKIST